MLLFRLYFWSYPPMMLLYFRVQFIPGEILDAFYWPLLFVMDHCPIWNAQYTEITFWWFLDWLFVSAVAPQVGQRGDATILPVLKRLRLCHDYVVRLIG